MREPKQTDDVVGVNTRRMQNDSADMPQNHRPGSTFGTTNKPQVVSAQPMPQSHGYGKTMFGGNVNNKPKSMPLSHGYGKPVFGKGCKGC